MTDYFLRILCLVFGHDRHMVWSDKDGEYKTWRECFRCGKTLT